jgi:hypothetical protein
MKQFLEKCYKYDIDIHCIFINFKQALIVLIEINCINHCTVKVAHATIEEMSVEEIFGKIHSDTLYDESRDLLSECDDDNVDSEICTGFEPEITRKIKLHNLSNDSGCGSAEKQDSNDENQIYAAGGTATWQE